MPSEDLKMLKTLINGLLVWQRIYIGECISTGTRGQRFPFYKFKMEETLVVRNQVTHSLAWDKRFIIMFSKEGSFDKCLSNSFKTLSHAWIQSGLKDLTLLLIQGIVGVSRENMHLCTVSVPPLISLYSYRHYNPNNPHTRCHQTAVARCVRNQLSKVNYFK